MPQKSNFHIVSAVLSVWVVVILARLIYLQVFQYPALSLRARRQQERTIEVSPVRGVISDRNLHPLAMSVEVDSIFAVPGEILNREAAAKLLSPVLNMSEDELDERLQGRRYFSWIKRKVSEREAARVRQLNLKGIYFQKESKRFYPKRDLAAHVLGYVGLDDHGLGGVEQTYESEIRGRPGQLLIETDARQQGLGRFGRPPEPGQNLVLTLDENIQYVAERELAAAFNEYHAASASVIVQDPWTGEILAMANQPTFNPNSYAEAGPEALRNLAVSAAYEPGSTFKIVTVAAALEEGLAKPAELIDCQMGSITLAGHVIHDHKRFGILSVSEIIQNSSDIGAIKLALRVGDDTMYRYLRSFGFGDLTGIELPGEARGLTKPPERWSKISIGAVAMGQEVGVTPLQLITAASAVANGGWLVKPHIVRGGDRAGPAHAPVAASPGRSRLANDGITRNASLALSPGRQSLGTPYLPSQEASQDVLLLSGNPAMENSETLASDSNTLENPGAGEGRRVISEETAAALRKMMRDVVTSGTAKSASLDGYTAAGKTGTAQKIDPETRTYSHRNYVASFVGFAPAESPLFTMLVVVDSPRGKIYGGDVAAPIFKRIAEQILAYRNVPPELPVNPALKAQSASARPPKTLQTSPDIAESPGEAADLNPASLLSLDSAIETPDFLGKTVRAVAEQAESENLEVQMTGSGIAYQQSPSPGSPLLEGQRIQVWFKVGRLSDMGQPIRQSTGLEAGQQSARQGRSPSGTSKPAPSRSDIPTQRPDRSTSSGSVGTSG